MKKLLLLAILANAFYAKNVKNDCTMINSDIAVIMQKILREVRASKPPQNACGVNAHIKIAHIDSKLKKEKNQNEDFATTPIDLRENFDFYIRGIKEKLERPFLLYNMNNAVKEKRLKNEYHLEIAAGREEVEPSGTAVIAKEVIKKVYQEPKEPWGVDEPENRDIQTPQKCNFMVSVNMVWVTSEPLNSVSGVVKRVWKGKEKKLKQGKVVFKRKGPNNGGATQAQAEIEDGFYKTSPNLPSGHYVIELTEPKECKKVIDDNWVFKSGLSKIKNFKVECKPEPYYTAIVTTKRTTLHKPLEQYRGIDKTLKSFEQDKDYYYLYFDLDKGVLHQFHSDSRSSRVIHNERYELNTQKCRYELQESDEKIKYLGGSPILKSEDNGWGFEESSKIYIEMPGSQKDISFTWGELRKKGSFFKKVKYKEKMPKLTKELFKQIQDKVKAFRDMSKNSKEVEIFKSFYNYPGTPQDVRCGGKVSLETLLIPPIDATYEPDVEFKIYIRKSTQKEKDIMKQVLKEVY